MITPLLDPDDALELVLESAPSPCPEQVPLGDALGRCLLQPLNAVVSLPPFSRAMMDGFAVHATDEGKTLRCIGELAAGAQQQGDLETETAVEVMTGAPLPQGADAVVKVEDIRRDGDFVTLPTHIESGQHIQAQGFLCRSGDELFPSGASLTSIGIASAISAGIATAVVGRKPSLTVLTTGNELVLSKEQLEPGQIYDSNGPMLEAMAKLAGAGAVTRQHCHDTKESLHEELTAACECDIIVLSGGVSMGRYDLVPDVLEELGFQRVFHKVRQKPGKPIFFATRKRQLVFGLPGTPLGSHFGMHRYVSAAIRQMLGLSTERAQGVGALTETLRTKGSRTLFRLARAERRAGVTHIVPGRWRGSSDLIGPGRANCYLRLEPGELELTTGTKLSFELIDGVEDTNLFS